MKKILFYSYILISIFIVGISSQMPWLITKLDRKEVLKYHPIDVIDYKLDSEVMDVQIVHRIYKISEVLRVSEELSKNYVFSTEDASPIFDSLQELLDAGIIVLSNKDMKFQNMDAIFVNITSYDIDSKYKLYSFEMNEQKILLGLDYETRKIIHLDLIGQGMFTLNANREELFREYVSYLNLEVLDDWKYNGLIYQSRKSELIVKISRGLRDEGEVYSLSIIPEGSLLD